MPKPPIASSGVEALIKRLKEDGVNAGQEKAQDIVTNAQQRAEWIIQEAELEAEQILSKAQTQAQALQTAGEDGLQLAARDAVLKLRDKLLESCSNEFIRLVGKPMNNEAFIQELILVLAGQTRQESGLDKQDKITVQLSTESIGVDDLRKNPEELAAGSLSHFAASIAADLLDQGIHFEVSEAVTGGIHIRLESSGMVVDFTDETVAALLLEHLQPRFRALLQGIVK